MSKKNYSSYSDDELIGALKGRKVKKKRNLTPEEKLKVKREIEAKRREMKVSDALIKGAIEYSSEGLGSRYRKKK